MTVTLNPRERDSFRAYRILEARTARLEGLGYIFGAGSVSLSTSTTTTAVAVADLTSTDVVMTSPASGDAASLDGWAYVSAVAAGQFTLTHANNTLSRTYRWLAVRPPR